MVHTINHRGALTRAARGPRRGMASVLAMLYLILFSTLALGFYAGTNLSAQVSRNDERIAEAQVAAEATLDWGRRQMLRWNPATGASASATLSAIWTQIQTTTNGTTNMNGHNPTQGVDGSGNSCIYIPGAVGSSYPYTYNWMSLGSSGAVGRLVISASGASSIIVKAVGMPGNGAGAVSASANVPTRAVELTYTPTSASWTPPPPGILSHGPISISNGAEVSGGSVTSATASGNVPLTGSGGAKIDQSFYYTANSKTPSLSNGASVGGSIVPNTTAPSFPTVDPTVFAAFVPSSTAPAGAQVINSSSVLSSNEVFTNIRIKANANVTFQNNEVLNGVIYVESPNNVTFASCTVNGIVVTDNNTSTPLSGNTLTFNNGVPLYGVETLNASSFPASQNIATLKTLSGALILAPNYQVVFAGGSKSYGDSIVASEFNMSNGYSGTVNGSIIMLSDTSFQMMGGGHITFATGSSSIAGLVGSSKLQLNLTTYAEVSP